VSGEALAERFRDRWAALRGHVFVAEDARDVPRRLVEASRILCGDGPPIAWAVADTGTVAVYGSASSALWPTLLPPVHVTVVYARQLVETVAEGLAILAADARARGGLPPMVKLISGPSSTADIEGQLWVGVHGPAQVGVVLVLE
jgi:hypothetical protein